MSIRSRGIAAVLVVASVLALGHYVQVWSAVPASLTRTSDFAGTYAASTLLRTGHAGSMYDESAERRVLAASGAPRDHLNIPFENPPAAAVLALPASVLDPDAAYRAWSLLQLLLLVMAVWIAVRAAPWRPALPRLIRWAIALLATAGFGTGLLFVEAQWDGVSVLGIALAYAAWRSGHAGRAGFAIGFTSAIAKPQLVLGVAAFMLGRRDLRGIAGALTGAAVATALGVIVAGPGALGDFVAAVAKPSNSPAAEMQGASGLFGSLAGPTEGAFVLASVTGLIAAGIAGWLGALSRGRRDLLEPALCGAVALSLFASPHLLGHDLTLLAPVLVAGLAWLSAAPSEDPWPGWSSAAAVAAWGALSLATVADLGRDTVGFPGRLTPWALLLVAAGWVLLTLRAAAEPRSAVVHVGNRAPRPHGA